MRRLKPVNVPFFNIKTIQVYKYENGPNHRRASGASQGLNRWKGSDLGSKYWRREDSEYIFWYVPVRENKQYLSYRPSIYLGFSQTSNYNIGKRLNNNISHYPRKFPHLRYMETARFEGSQGALSFTWWTLIHYCHKPRCFVTDWEPIWEPREPI